MCYFTILVILAGGQSNLTTGRIATAHGWFSGIRQVAPVCVCTPPMHASLGPDVKSQTASRSVQAFLHSSQQGVTILYNRLPRPPQNCRFPWGDLDPHLIHGSLGPSESTTQTASRSLQPFFHSSPQSVPILYNEPPLPPENCHFPWGIWTPM